MHSIEPVRQLSVTKLSKHAKKRSDQRSIPQCIIDALVDFGDRCHVGESRESCYFTKKSWRTFSAYMGSEAKYLERYRSAYAIISGGAVVTAAWRH